MPHDVPASGAPTVGGATRPPGAPRPTVISDPATDPRWQALVTARRSDVFHSPAWMRVLQQTYGFDVQAHLILGANDIPDAGFAFVPVDDVLGVRTVSLPFSDFCDPLVDEDDQWVTLADSVLDQAATFTVKVLFNEVAERDARLAEHGRSKWHRADVTPDVESMWQRLHSSARRAVRKSANAGTRIKPAESLLDVRSFFDLHLRVRKLKYGLLAQPWAFFEAIWDHFLADGHGRLLLAEHDGDVVSGVLFLRWNDTLYYKLNASDRDALALRPNDAVLWEGLRLAHAMGLQWLDFGISALDQEGLIRYKRKYATEEREVRVLRTTPSVPDKRAEALRGLLPQLTDLFVRPDVPDDVTRQAGDLLYRYFV